MTLAGDETRTWPVCHCASPPRPVAFRRAPAVPSRGCSVRGPGRVPHHRRRTAGRRKAQTARRPRKRHGYGPPQELAACAAPTGPAGVRALVSARRLRVTLGAARAASVEDRVNRARSPSSAAAAARLSNPERRFLCATPRSEQGGALRDREKAKREWGDPCRGRPTPLASGAGWRPAGVTQCVRAQAGRRSRSGWRWRAMASISAAASAAQATMPAWRPSSLPPAPGAMP